MNTATSCPECSSANVIFSKKHGRHVCEDCGHEFDPVEPFVAHRVFISYGHDEHATLAIRLRDDLRKRGHEAWFDEERLQPGHDWEAGIERGLAWAAEGRPRAAILLLLTPHSVRRPDGYCLNEVARALMLGLRIIPLMVVESEPPLSICRVQWLDMRMCIPIHEKEALYAPKFERLLAALERDELDFEGTQSLLLRVLQPIQFSADLLKLLRDFAGRQWVFDEVDRWFADPAGAKVFWLTGAPGVGKSAIAAWIRERRREVAAFHFCDSYSEEKRNPAKLVCSIVYQLSTQLPEYEARLARLPLESIVQEYHEAYTLFDKLLVQPLADAFPAPDRSVVVLIDALDEATAARRNEIVLFLSRCADKTPAWLRFLVTSRPEPEIVSALQRLSPFVLDTGRKENLDDLQLYLQKQLPGITPQQTAEILRRSEGVFLYTAHVADEVRAGTLSLARINEFPRGLGDVYQRFFERQFGHDMVAYEERITPLLQAIFAAREPLTPGYLRRLCGIAGETELERLLNRLGSLFPTSGEGEAETIRAFHRSLGDWITDRQAAGHFVIRVADGHRLLADHGLREYQQGVGELSPYALRHLPTHLCEAGRWDALIGDDATPGPLTDLLFIQAKCEAGLVHDLVADYNTALAALPEFREENERLARRDAAMLAYNKALRQHAVTRYDWLQAKERGEPRPAPPYPPLPPELQDATRMVIPEESSPRAARLRHFANFVSGHLALLAQFPHDTLPLAFNQSQSGPVAAQAEMLIGSRNQPWLERSPRPPTNSLRPQCLRTLDGHGKGVTGASISPDGRRAVSAGRDGTIRHWHLASAKCLLTLEGHEAEVLSVDVCANGWRAVSAGADTTLRLWDLASGELLRTLEGHRAGVTSVAVSLDGNRAVSAGDDNVLRVWDLESGDCLQILKGHSAGVNCVTISAEGCRAVSASNDNTLRLWDLNSGECLRILKGHCAEVTSVSLSEDGCRAVSGSNDTTLRIWDLDTGECLRVLEGHIDSVTCVSVSPDGRHAVSAGFGKTLRLWNLLGARSLRTLEGHSSAVSAVKVCPDGRHALSACSDRTLRLWDLERDGDRQIPDGHSNWITSVNVSPDGHRAVSASEDRTLRLWDLASGECLHALEGHHSRVNSVCIFQDGRRAISASLDDTLRIWNLDSGECLRLLEGHVSGVSGVTVSADGKQALSASWDNTLRLWDIESGDCLRVLRGHSDRVWRVSTVRDGRRAVSAGRDKTLRLWNLESGDCLRTFQGHTAWVTSFIVSPDECLVVSAGRDRTVRVWDLKSGSGLHTLEGHSGLVWRVSVSPDGRRAVSAADDDTLRIWDLRSGNCIGILAGHCAPVNCVSISPDGCRAVSASEDRTLRLWDLKSGECLTVYTATAALCSATHSPSGDRIICGSHNGLMHFLTPINLPPSGPAIVTATNLGSVRCPCCAAGFVPSPEIAVAIHSHAAILRPDKSPCLDLPDSAFADPRLLSSCPHCAKPLKFNPFFVES